MENLTPQLNEQQLRENIDALQKQGVTNDKVQAYVDNYSKGGSGNYVLKNAPQAPQDNDGGIGGFVKGLVSAPATIFARPFQAVAESLGASSEDVDKFSDKYLGGLVKPVPQNAADVEKDVGRGVQTVGLGLGPVAGGATLGLGNALEQGGDLLSIKTAFETALGAGGGKLLDLIGKPVFNVAGKVIDKVTPQFLQDLAGKGVDAIKNFAEQHEILPSGISSAINKGEQKISGAFEKPFNAVGDKAKEAVSKTRSYFTPKTDADILATPENRVHTLSKVERDFYRENQKNNINESSPKSNLSQEEILATPESKLHTLSDSERKFYNETEKAKISDETGVEQNKVSQEFEATQEKIKNENDVKTKMIDDKATQDNNIAKQNLQNDSEKAQIEAEKLQRSYSESSKNTVIRTRPEAKAALSRQSQTYKNIVEEELGPHKDTVVKQNEIGDFINNKYSADEAKASRIKEKLGIETFPENMPPAAKKLAELQGQSNDITVGEVYDKAKSMRQEIGTSARKGTRVYTPEEKETDDAISALTDFLKSKGIDTPQARAFWSKYAPVRDQLITEGKIFNTAGTQTKILANTISRVARGADVNNENFIKAVSKLLGEDITAEQKVIFEKMNQNQKQQLARKIETETKIETIKNEKQQNIENTKKETEMAIKENRLKRDQAIERSNLEKDKEYKRISSREFDAKKQSLDNEMKVQEQKKEALKQLEIRHREIERKATIRKVILRTIKVGVGGITGSQVGGVQGEIIGGVIGASI